LPKYCHRWPARTAARNIENTTNGISSKVVSNDAKPTNNYLSALILAVRRIRKIKH